MPNENEQPNNIFFSKLLKLQEILKPILKEETNPYFRSRYFNINGLLESIKPALNETGLVILQPLGTIGEGKPAITTMILDPATSQSISSHFPLPVIEDPQKMGSAITYYRRYALQSALLLEAEDDDGNAASGKFVPDTKQPGVSSRPLPKAPTPTKAKDYGARKVTPPEPTPQEMNDLPW